MISKKLTEDHIVFLKVGWMIYYRGLNFGDSIKGAGSIIEKQGWGSEIYNFDAYKEKVYGCAQINEKALVSRLSADKGADHIGNVLVVWVAPSRYTSGVYIVGWYRNATIYADRDHLLPNSAGRSYKGHRIEYIVETEEINATLLPEHERNFPVPVGKGLMGNRLFVYYADAENQKQWRHKAISYIEGTSVSGLGDEDVTSIEGDIKVRTHNVYERDPGLIKKAKEKFKSQHNGNLYCEICKFDFKTEYGKLGDKFIEAHHITPLHFFQKPQKTSIEDLMMVCRNCHFMLHKMIKEKGGLTRDESLKLKNKKWTEKYLSK